MSYLNKQDLAFCVKRLPAPLKKMMKEEGSKIVVAGGYIRSVITGEKISDVDVFAGDKERSVELATILANDTRLITTSNAVTLRNMRLPVQFIHRWVYDNPIDIVASFDFTICQAAMWFDLGKKKWNSSCGSTFYQDLAAKRLVYLSPIRNEDAGGSLIRVLKYYQRGYRIPLSSFGAVIARLVKGIEFDKIREEDRFEERLATILTSLLIEVDPNSSFDELAYLPDEEEDDD